jgi:hypothetical protein
MVDAQSGQFGDDNKRRGDRRRVLLTGLVAYADLGVSFRCVIRDRSETGARIKIPVSILVPTQFWLIDVAEGLAYDATAVWRRYPEVGVALADPISLQHPGHDLLQRRLRALWIAVAPRR